MTTEPIAPLEGLMRSVPFEVLRADAEGDGLTLEGYAAVFNARTTINSWEGNFDEVISPGAFKKTLRERTPVLMFNHGQHPVIGDMPIGAITSAREDGKGVLITARLSDNWLVQPVRDAIAEGSVKGMSFRFSVVKEEWEQPTRKGSLPVRTLLELKVPELGPVVFPAYAETSVGVRASQAARDLADPEFRADLARALLLGTSDPAAREGTEQDAATPMEPVIATPRITQHERRRRAAQIRLGDES